MKKKSTNSSISKEEFQKRLQMRDAADQLDRMRKDMDTSPQQFSGKPNEMAPIESLSGIGESEETIYEEVVKILQDLMDKIGSYAFTSEQYPRYFPNSKIISLVRMMRSAGLELEARTIMDIFKDRVKARQGGKLPVIKVKEGMFSKATQRNMKPEEIAKKFDVEDSLPPDEVEPLGAHGTKKGLLRYLQSIFLESDESTDPMKKVVRKSLGLFLKEAGLLNFKTKNSNENYFAASLVTPDSLQPKSRNDKESLVKYRSVLNKGIKFLDEKLKATTQEQEESSNKQQ